MVEIPVRQKVGPVLFPHNELFPFPQRPFAGFVVISTLIVFPL